MLTPDDLTIATLGECRYDSPMNDRKHVGFVSDSIRIRYQHKVGPELGDVSGLSFEEAGPRRTIFFDPAHTTAALVTCGGLSPGLNNVIRSAFLELLHNYGVRRILGIRNGYMGLNPARGLGPVVLNTDLVESIHDLGGTVLGSSRGPEDPAVIVDYLERERIDILFCIGGDGTQRGAQAIAREVGRRGLKKAIVGIPKTIDNDIPFVWKSFGYDTALGMAAEVLGAGHVEAKGAPNGIALVKLMGRHSGFIAAGAALASQDANFVLIPEVPFPLDGDGGFLAALERRVRERGHALIVVAEGAGQHLFGQDGVERDASGNVKLHDIGPFLRDRIKAHFEGRNLPINLKYLDPSYLIRSVPANASDRILCDWMARSAVHAAMAGRTDMLVGYWGQELVHVPIRTAIAGSRQVDLSGDLWTSVLWSTGQPHW